MRILQKASYLWVVAFVFTGCGAYFNQPVSQQEARIGERTTRSEVLENFPTPAKPVVVGVYNFKDQTGQYKALENGSTFSNAVPQGGTTMLIKALEDSKWFDPIERENLSNLLQERQIIRSTRDEYRKNKNPNEPTLPPLLYAGILLEGAVVSYDTNIITGGAGARYFGVGGSTQYRQDRLTIYLRAVSTSSGRILKTVYVSKTILSQAVNASLFKYVNFQRLLEVETGFTKNEPVQLAMKDAIEKAVESLIIEGIMERLWSTQEGAKKNQELIDAYLAEKELEESTRLYERQTIEKETGYSVDAGVGLTYFDGDFTKKELSPMLHLGINKRISPNFIIGGSGKFLEFRGGRDFYARYLSATLNLEYDFLPKDALSPFVKVGGGFIFDGNTRETQVNYTAGLDFRISKQLSLRVFAEHNLTFSDQIDFTINGTRDDFYYNFGVGVRYHFKKALPKEDQEQDSQIPEN